MEYQMWFQTNSGGGGGASGVMINILFLVSSPQIFFKSFLWT